MTTYFGLYYPYTDFQDDNWLKASSLFWDQIYHIVPDNYVHRRAFLAQPFPDTLREASDRYHARPWGLLFSGYVQATTADNERAQVGREFLRLLEEYGPQLCARYPIPEDKWHTSGQKFPPYDSSGRAYIFSGKIDSELSLALQDLGLADSGSLAAGPGLAMHPRLAWVYMTALAEAVARSGGLHLLSEDPLNHVAVSGWGMDQLARSLLGEPESGSEVNFKDARVGLMAGIALRCVMPADLSNVSVEQLIDFRERYAEERGKFQDTIQALVTNIAHLDDVKDPAQFLNHVQAEYGKSLMPQIKDLKKRLRGSGIATVSGVINAQTALPPLLATAAAQAHITNPAVLTGSAVALSLWSVRQNIQQARRQALASSPVAYLYHVQTGLRPAFLARQIRTATRRFG